MPENKYPNLLSPLKIGPVTVRNRTFLSAMVGNFIEREAEGWWDRYRAYQVEITKGGVGYIVMSEMGVHPTQCKYEIPVPDMRHVPFLRKLTDDVHKHGGTIFQMLHALGREAGPFYTRKVLWSASPLPGMTMEVPHEMDKDDIKEAIAGYRSVAAVVKAGGYDGIVVEGGGTFLIGGFMSGWANKRTDEYGGSLKNRARFALEISEAVREAIGPDLALGLAFSVDEVSPYEDGAITLEEGLEFGRLFDESGLFDFLECRIGSYRELFTCWAPDSFTPQCFCTYGAKEFKKIAKNVKVATVGRIRKPADAERIVAEGEADLIGLGRPLWADPQWVNKARDGREDEIYQCVSDNQCLLGVRAGRFPTYCIVNPALGRERTLGAGKIPKAKKRKRVVIVGGGPGGLKCAEMAAGRGHEVILLEKGKQLGGAVREAATLPGLEELNWIVDPIINITKRMKVDVRLNTSATADMILSLSPDAVVVATGSIPVEVPFKNPPLPVCTAEEVLSKKVKVGERVVVYDDNMAMGDENWKYCGTALKLAEEGKKVTMVTAKFFAAAGLPYPRHPNLLAKLGQHKVKAVPTATFVRLESGAIIVKDVYSGEETKIPADTVVWVTNRVADDALFRELKGKVAEVYEIGDALAPRRIESAIYEGFEIGLKL
jgi:2,4-dienoyl-CoA reductase-like NADH-dependent reductase (Old Yellow Enzyme family)/thioredoxin reductase